MSNLSPCRGLEVCVYVHWAFSFHIYILGIVHSAKSTSRGGIEDLVITV